MAFDVEATGLSAVDDRIVELAASAFRAGGSIEGSFRRLVNPGIPIPSEQTLLHGISDGMVGEAPSFQRVVPDFVRFAGDAVLVAHNAYRDVAMLMGPRPEGLAGNLVLDTCTLARAAFPGLRDYRLATVAARLGIETGRQHSAMDDVATCRSIFLAVLEGRPGVETLGELIDCDGNEIYLGGSRGRFGLDGIMPGVAARIEYLGGSKGPGPRPVTPITVMVREGVPTLLAHCHLDGDLKAFRLNKIRAFHPA